MVPFIKGALTGLAFGIVLYKVGATRYSRVMGMLTLRSCRVGVVADSPGYGRRSLRSPKDEHGNVVMTGEPSEIVLYLFGRGEVADVELDGADHDVAAFRETNLGV